MTDAANFCSSCGERVSVEPKSARPILGISIGVILGMVGLSMALYGTVTNYTVGADSSQTKAFEMIPGLSYVFYIAPVAGVICNLGLISALAWTFFRKPSGPAFVRAAIYVRFAAAVLEHGASYYLFSTSPIWQLLVDAQTKSAFSGRVLGSLIGTALESALLLYLFRKSRWP